MAKVMVWATASWLLLPASLAIAGNMIAIGKEQFCKNHEDECYEWRFRGLRNIRLVTEGYEDGVNHTFYRIGADGTYIPIIDVIPVIDVSAKKFTWEWQELQDLPVELGPRGPIVWAAFDADIDDSDGQNCHPASQRRVAAVLFHGTSKVQNSLPLGSYAFHRVSLEALAAQSRIRPANTKTQINSCPVR
jgi:hypothetical protein